MSNAISAHGALVAVELDPTGAAGTFTTIGELASDINLGFSRPEDEATPHNDTIDSYTFGVLQRDAWTFTVNYIFNNGQHDHLTGLQAALKDNEKRGYRFRGAASTGADVDEWICSGNVQSFSQSNPVRSGTRSADFTVRMSGVMKIDGVDIGSVG